MREGRSFKSVREFPAEYGNSARVCQNPEEKMPGFACLDTQRTEVSKGKLPGLHGVDDPHTEPDRSVTGAEFRSEMAQRRPSGHKRSDTN